MKKKFFIIKKGYKDLIFSAFMKRYSAMFKDGLSYKLISLLVRETEKLTMVWAKD